MELFTDLDYLAVLTEQYGGANNYYSDRYVFNSQEGNGFGSALSSLGSFAMPVLRKLLPFLKDVGKKAIKGGVEYAFDKVNEKAGEQFSERLTKKRKRTRYNYNKRKRL